MSLMESIPMFDVPMVWPDSPRVRRNDPITSHEAADRSTVAKSHADVLWFLGVEPGAQFEAEEAFQGFHSPSRVRSAFSELEAQGLVERTDEFRVTPSGRRAQVWRLA